MAFRPKPRGKARPRRRPSKSKNSLKNQIKRTLLRATETKQSITNGTEISLPINAGGLVHLPLDAVVQGVGKTNRVGNSIMASGIDVRGHINMSGSTGSGQMVVRLIVVRKQSPNDSFVTNGLENNGGNFGPVSNTLSDIYARVNVDRYKLLYNKVWSIAATTTANVPSVRLFKQWIPMKHIINYDEGSAPPVKGQVEFVWICRDTQNDATTGNAELNYNYKLYFKDP